MTDDTVVPVAVLERACASAGAALAGVRPEQLDEATPCGQCRVRDLIDHIAGAAARAVGPRRRLGSWPSSR